MADRVRTDRIAQGEVANLCRAAGGTVTPVDEDENGWDIMVEFPSAVQSAIPDLSEPLRRCLIQVKSTVSRRASTYVKLSNALKLAQDPLPCFTVLLTYPNGRTKFEAAYLRHEWASTMMDTLQKARRATVEQRPLHKEKVSIQFSRIERHDDDLITALLEAIERVGPDYAGKKKKLVGTLGYEKGLGTANFVLAKGHDYRDLEDLLLGLRKDLPLQHVTFNDNRFGMPLRTKRRGPATLSVDLSRAEKCAVTLARRDTNEEIIWPGTFYPSGLDFVPLKERRIRVSAGPLDVIISGDGTVIANWSARLDAPRQLDELARDAQFRAWMDGSSMDVTVWTERANFPPFSVKFESKSEEGWEEVMAALKVLTAVVPSVRRPADLQISMSDFLDGMPQHRLFTGMAGPDRRSVKIEAPEVLKSGIERATHIIFPWISWIGDYCIISVIEREISKCEREGKVVFLSTVAGRILRGTAVKTTAASDALLSGEVRWAKERADQSDKRIVSFHPTGDGFGDLELASGGDEDSDGH